MNIVIDCRESALIASCRRVLLLLLPSTNTIIHLVVRALPLGDVLLERVDDNSPLLIIERKALPDLLASITDGRYAEQSFRLAHHTDIVPHNVVYLLEGSIAALPLAADRQRCFSVLASCQYWKGFSTCRTESLEDTANYLVATATKLERDLRSGRSGRSGAKSGKGEGEVAAAYAGVVHAVKKDNLTPANIGAVLLSQIPGFSAASAQLVVASVGGGGIYAVMQELGDKEGRDRLRSLPIGSTTAKPRRLGDAAVARLCRFLRPDVVDFTDTAVGSSSSSSSSRKKRPPPPSGGDSKKKKASVFPTDSGDN